MDNTVVFKVGDLVRFKTEKASKEWPNFEFNQTYIVAEVEGEEKPEPRFPRLWDDNHNHCWWIHPENLEILTPESTIDIWATP